MKIQNVGNWGSNRYPQSKNVGGNHFLWRDGDPARQRNVNQCLVESLTGRALTGQEAYVVFYDTHEAVVGDNAPLIVDLAQASVSDAGYGISPAYGDGEVFERRHQSSRWQTSGGMTVMADTSHTARYARGTDGRVRFAR